MSLLGVVAVVCAILYVGFLIQDGLHTLEQHNDDTRAVLATLAARRDKLIEAKSRQNEVVSMIGAEPQSLPTYLEKVGGTAGVQIRAQSEKPTVTKGKFHEHSTQLTLFDVSVEQLANFLRGIETQSPVVVTQHLVIKRSSLQKEKLDRVEITVATYSRPKKAAAGEKAAEKDKPAGEKSP